MSNGERPPEDRYPRENKRLDRELRRIEHNAKRKDLEVDWKIGRDSRNSEEATYMAAVGQILVDTDVVTVADVQAALGQLRPPVRGNELESGVPGLAVLAVTAPGRSTAEVVSDLRSALGSPRSDGVSQNFILDAQGWGAACPATEPEPMPAPPVPPIPGNVGPGSGSSVLAAVLDTGFLPRTASEATWLTGISNFEDDSLAFEPSGEIAPYGGHGTFTAGVLRCAAGPQTAVVVRRSMTGGVVTEAAITADLVAVLAMRPRVINISAGVYTDDGREPLSFRVFSRLLRQVGPDLVVLAAAGNQATDDPFWPAAGSWATGVGATDANRQPTDWSNTGRNVACWTVGTDHVNAFPNGTYRALVEGPDGSYSEELRTFDGWRARWSGTSFASPYVAGKVAARLVSHGGSAADALAAVLASSGHRIDGAPFVA